MHSGWENLRDDVLASAALQERLFPLATEAEFVAALAALACELGHTVDAGTLAAQLRAAAMRSLLETA